MLQNEGLQTFLSKDPEVWAVVHAKWHAYMLSKYLSLQVWDPAGIDATGPDVSTTPSTDRLAPDTTSASATVYEYATGPDASTTPSTDRLAPDTTSASATVYDYATGPDASTPPATWTETYVINADGSYTPIEYEIDYYDSWEDNYYEEWDEDVYYEDDSADSENQTSDYVPNGSLHYKPDLQAMLGSHTNNVVSALDSMRKVVRKASKFSQELYKVFVYWASNNMDTFENAQEEFMQWLNNNQDKIIPILRMN